MINLSVANANESEVFSITGVKTDNKLRNHLLGMGVGVGIDIGVLRNRNGDVVLGNGNNRISLGREIAEQIFVKSLGVKL